MSGHLSTERPHRNVRSETNGVILDQARKGDIKLAINFLNLLAQFPWAMTERVRNLLKAIGLISNKK